MECILMVRLPNLYMIIKFTKIKKGFWNKKRKGERFFFKFLFYLFKKNVCHYASKLIVTTVREACERGCSWIIKFSHYLDFGYCKDGIIIFSIQIENGCTRCTHEEKNLWSEQLLIPFLRPLYWFFFHEELAAIFQWSRMVKSQNFCESWWCLTETMTLGN